MTTLNVLLNSNDVKKVKLLVTSVTTFIVENVISLKKELTENEFNLLSKNYFICLIRQINLFNNFKDGSFTLAEQIMFFNMFEQQEMYFLRVGGQRLHSEMIEVVKSGRKLITYSYENSKNIE